MPVTAAIIDRTACILRFMRVAMLAAKTNRCIVVVMGNNGMNKPDRNGQQHKNTCDGMFQLVLHRILQK